MRVGIAGVVNRSENLEVPKKKKKITAIYWDET
jgi:hypothetical protein